MTGAIGRALCIVTTLLSVAIFVPTLSLAVSGAANAQCRSGDYTCDYPGTKTVGTGQYATKVQCMRNAPCRDTTAQTTTNGKCVAFETCSVSKETDKDITGKPSGWQGEGDTSGGSTPSSPGSPSIPSIPNPGSQPPNADPTNSFTEPAKPTDTKPSTKGESILERFFKSFGGPSTAPGENTTDPLGMPTGINDSGNVEPDMNNNYGYGNTPEDNFGYGNQFQDGNTTFGPQVNPTPSDDAPWYERAWNSVTAALTPSATPSTESEPSVLVDGIQGYPSVQPEAPNTTELYGYGNPKQSEGDPRLPAHFDPYDPLFSNTGKDPIINAADIKLSEKLTKLSILDAEFKPLGDRATELNKEMERLAAGAQKTNKGLVFKNNDDLKAFKDAQDKFQKLQPQLYAASTQYGEAHAEYIAAVQAYNKEFNSISYDAMGRAYGGPNGAENAMVADRMTEYNLSSSKFYDAFGGEYSTPSQAVQADRFLLKNSELADQYVGQEKVVEQARTRAWTSSIFDLTANRAVVHAEEARLTQLKDAMTTNTAVANYLGKGPDAELFAERLNVNPKTPQELAVRSLMYGQAREWDQNYSTAEIIRNGSTEDLLRMGYIPPEGQDITREDILKHYQFRSDLSAGRIAELTGAKEMTPQTLWSIATLTKSPDDFAAFNRAYIDVSDPPMMMTVLGEDRYHKLAGEVYAFGQTSIDSFVTKAFKDASERFTWTTPWQWAPGAASLLAGSIVGNVGEFVGLPTTQRSIEMLSQTPGEIAFSRGISGPMALLDMTTLSAPKLAFTGTSLALREASLAAGEFKFGAGLTEGLSAADARYVSSYARVTEKNISEALARGEIKQFEAQSVAYNNLYEQIARSDGSLVGSTRAENIMSSLRARMEGLDITPPSGFQPRGATVADSVGDVTRGSDQVVTPPPSTPSSNLGNIPRTDTPINSPATGGRVADAAADVTRAPDPVVTSKPGAPTEVSNIPRAETPVTNPSTVSPVTNTARDTAATVAHEAAVAEALADKAVTTQQAAAARTYEEAFAARTKAEEVQVNLNTQIARELESMAAQNVVRETDTLRQLRQANADIQNVQTDLAKTMAREAVSSPPNISRSPYNEVVLSNKFGPIGRAQTLAASVFAESALSVRRIVTAPDKLLQAAIAAFQIQVGGIEAGNAGTNALESIYRASIGENMLTLTPDEVARLTNPSRTISSPIASRVSDAVAPVVSTALPISRFDATDLLGNANPFVQSTAVQTPRGVGLASEVSSAQQSFITYEGGKVVFNFKSANEVAPGGASYSIDLANLRVSAVSTVPQPSVPNTAPAQVTPGTAVTAQAPAQTVPVTTSRYGVAFFTNGIPNAAKSVWNSIVSPSQAAEPVARVSAPTVSQAAESARPLLSRNDIEKMMQVGPVDEARVPSFQPSNFLNGPATQPKELLGSLSPVERVEKITETMRNGEEALNALWKQRFAEIGKEFSPPAVLPGKWFNGDQFIVTQNSIRFNIAASHYDNFGNEAVLSALAHEYGHAVQTQLGILPSNENIRLYEMQADYLAGTALRPLFEQGLLKPGDEEFIYYSRVYQGRDLHNERNGINSLLGRVAPDSELRLATARVRGDLVNQGLRSGDWTKEVNVFDGSKIAPITGQKFGAVTPSNVIVPEGGSLAATLPSRLALEGANWLSNFSPRQALAQAWDSIKPISSARAATPPVGGEVAVPTAPAGSPVSARTTFYGPGAGGTVQGGWETSRANLEGLKNERGSPIPRTLDDVRLGKAGYVSLAVDPSNYGKFYNLGPVTYKSVLDKKIYTGDKLAAEASLKKTDPNLHMTYVPQLEKVIGYAHDTGGAFTGRPDKFDIAVGDFRGWSAGDSMRFLTSAGQEYGGNKLNTWQQINPVQARQYIAAVTAKPPSAVAEMTPKPAPTQPVVEAVRSANTAALPSVKSTFDKFKERLNRPVKAVQAAFTPAPAVNPPVVTSRGPAQAAPQESVNAPRRLSGGGNKESEVYTELSVSVGRETLMRQGYIFVPANIDATKPVTVVLYMHGQLENGKSPSAFSNTVERQRLAQQIRDSGMNAVLVAPNMDAIPAASGYFSLPGETTKFLAVAEHGIAQSIGIPQDALKDAPVVLVTYSGGYYPAGKILESGELNQRLSAILMLDSGYGDEANGFLRQVKNWSEANPSGIVVSGYTVSTKAGNDDLTKLFRNQRTGQLTRTIVTSPLPAGEVIKPGTFAQIQTRGAAVQPHRNYVTDAGLTTAGVQPPIQTFLQMLPPATNPAATAVAQGTPNTIQTTARPVATTVAKPVSDLANRALTRLGQRADIEAIRPATVPPANIQSTASQEQLAQQAIAQERARNAAATDVQLAAAVGMRGAENTNAFEQLRVNIAKSLAKSSKQSDVNKAYTPANVAIAKEMAERLKPTELNPNPRLESWTKDQPGTTQKLVNDYLWEAYQRQPLKIDSGGDFTWKDITGALNSRNSLRDYVIGGMNERLRTNLYFAGKAMDEAGIQWSFLAGYRGLERPAATGKVVANPLHSEHYAGGYGLANAADLGGVGVTAAQRNASNQAVWNWLKNNQTDNAAKYGLRAKFVPNDPAHVVPNTDRKLHATQQSDIQKILASNPQPPTSAPAGLAQTPDASLPTQQPTAQPSTMTGRFMSRIALAPERFSRSVGTAAEGAYQNIRTALTPKTATAPELAPTAPQATPAAAQPAATAPSSPVTTVQGLTAEQVAGIKKYVDAQEVLKKAPIGDQAATRAYNASIDDLKKVGLTLNDYGLVYYSPTEGRNANVVSTEALRAAGFDRTAQGQLMAANGNVTPPSVKIVDVVPVAPQPVPAVAQPTPPVPGATETVRGWLQRSQEEFSRVTKQLRTGEPSSEVAKPAPNVFTSSDGEIIVHRGSAENLHEMVNPNPFKETFSSIVPKPVEIPAVISSVDDVALAQQKRLKEVSESMLKAMYGTETLDAMPARTYREPFLERFYRAQLEAANEAIVRLEINKTQNAINDLAPGGVVADAARAQFDALADKLTSQKIAQSELLKGNIPAYSAFLNKYATSQKFTQAGLTAEIRSGEEYLVKKLGADWRATDMRNVDPLMRQSIEIQMRNEALAEYVRAGKIALAENNTPTQTASRANLIADLRAGIDTLVQRITPSPSRVATPAAEPVETLIGSDGDVIVVKREDLIDPEIPTGVASNPAPVAQQTPAAPKPVPAVSQPVPTVKHAPTTNVTEVVRQATRPTVAVPGDEYKVTLKTVDENLKKLQSVEVPLLETLQSVTSSFNRTGDRGVLKARLKEAVPAYQNYNSLRLQTLSELQKLQKNPALSAKEAQELGRAISTLNSRGSQLGRMLKEDAFMSAVSLFDINGSLSAHLTKVSIAAKVLQETRLGAANTVARLASAEETRVIAAANAPAKAVQANAAPVTAPTPVTTVEVTPVAAPTAPAPAVANSGSAPTSISEVISKIREDSLTRSFFDAGVVLGTAGIALKATDAVAKVLKKTTAAVANTWKATFSRNSTAPAAPATPARPATPAAPTPAAPVAPATPAAPAAPTPTAPSPRGVLPSLGAVRSAASRASAALAPVARSAGLRAFAGSSAVAKSVRNWVNARLSRSGSAGTFAATPANPILRINPTNGKFEFIPPATGGAAPTASLPGRFLQGTWSATKWCFSGFGKFTACAVGGGIGYYILEAVDYSLSGDTAAAPAGTTQPQQNPNTQPKPGTQQPGTQSPGTRTPGSPDTPGTTPGSDTGTGGLGSLGSLANIAKSLPQLMQNLKNLFNPQQSTQPTTPTNIPAVKLDANPMSVVSGTTTRLSWSSENTASCTVIGPGSATLTRGGASGVITSPALATSTEFAVICAGIDGLSATNATVTVSVEGSTAPTVPVILPAGVTKNASYSTAFNSSSGSAGSGSASGTGTGNGNTTSGNGTNEAPVTPKTSGVDQYGNKVSAWCDPNQSIDTYTTCLCNLEPTGCYPWRTRQQ